MSRVTDTESFLAHQRTEDAAVPRRPVTDPGVAPPHALIPGSAFRGLRIHSRLGDGGMGITYLASHPVLQMPLVIKTFKTLSADRSQIFREAHYAARVTSPHVVPPVDAGFEEGVPFVVQRYVDGIDTDELLTWFRRMGRRLPISAVIRMIADIARGLHAIHQAGVVHRDVKPANLFLAGYGEAAVGDFGIALETLDRKGGELAGTPEFIAPEGWEAGRAIDRRADVYSLGATAHLLATGATPFHADTLTGLREAHRVTPYLPPTASEPREAYFFAVVERMLRKAPEDRYPNADAVSRALSLVAERPPFLSRTGPFAARYGQVEVQLVTGDLVETPTVDVIVNSANTTLRMRQGVADALRHAAGDAVEREAMERGEVAMGDVVWTGAGALPAKHMAHAVSAMDGGSCVQRCMLRLLLEAEVRQCSSIAMPVIGTGIGRVPLDLGAKLMLEAIRTFAGLKPHSVKHIRIHLLDDTLKHRFWAILDSM